MDRDEERAIELFNSFEWVDADNKGLRGLTDHIPLIAKALREARAEERKECAMFVAIHAQYPIHLMNDYDRGYSNGRKDAAAAIKCRAKGGAG